MQARKTALHYAAMGSRATKGCEGVVEVLLDAGADHEILTAVRIFDLAAKNLNVDELSMGGKHQCFLSGSQRGFQVSWRLHSVDV